MIITLEHEDIEAALIQWMNDKGMTANAETTSIAMSKARNSGKITAVIDPNGKAAAENPTAVVTLAGGPDVAATADVAAEMEGVEAPPKKLFNT